MTVLSCNDGVKATSTVPTQRYELVAEAYKGISACFVPSYQPPATLHSSTPKRFIAALSNMEKTSRTRGIIESVFSKISNEGFGQAFLSHLSENVVWTANGTSPMRGRYEGKKAYTEQVLSRLRERIATPGRPIVDRILVDGEWAAVNFHTVGAKAVNGVDFSMEYCWLMRVVDERIVEVSGFYDARKMCDLFE